MRCCLCLCGVSVNKCVCVYVREEALLISSRSQCVVLQSHLSDTPAIELNRPSSPLRMLRQLKGYTVMALTS